MTKLYEQLKKMDREERGERLKRLEYITKLFNEDKPISLPRKTQRTYNTIEEAKFCFVYGFFISTVVLSQVFIEQMIRIYVLEARRNKGKNRVWENDDDEKQKNKYVYLLKEAKRYGILNEQEYKDLDKLRELRNSLIHLTQKRRNKLIIDIHITETDAQFAIQMMSKVINSILSGKWRLAIGESSK